MAKEMRNRKNVVCTNPVVNVSDYKVVSHNIIWNHIILAAYGHQLQL